MTTALDRLAPSGRRVAATAARGRKRSQLEQPERVGVTIDDVSVRYRTAEGDVDAVSHTSLAIPPGSTSVILGPSGCGKTSLLRAIAGLERPTTGSITIGDTVVSNAGPSASAWVKPERRNVGMVFQDGALFPHLTVAENIAFGLRAGRRSGSKVRARIDELLELVDLGGLGDRRPDTLSGGQQQRIALARSLAPNPSVLLLDEPFSALDAGLRVQVRSEVLRILREVGVTSVFVTHDQDEAFLLGDSVTVMRDGHVEQTGTPDQLYRSPANQWVAEFVGEANLLSGPVLDRHVQTVIGPVPLLGQPTDGSGNGSDAGTVIVRPEQIELGSADEGDLTAHVVAVEYYGHDVRYELQLSDGSVVAARTTPHVLREVGDVVGITYLGAPTSICPDG